MTCIAGIAIDGAVYIGGDSAGVAGWDLCVRSDAKVFKLGDFVIGFTTSFRMGQLLRYSLTLPVRESGKDIMAFMVTDFVEAIRKCLKEGGYAQKINEGEQAGEFLVGYSGRLFKICSDYQVAENLNGIDSCGSGSAYAIGAMQATESHVETKSRILKALKIAVANNAGVRGPFHVETI